MVPALWCIGEPDQLLLDTVLASLLPTGSVSWLYYSDRLTELPLGGVCHCDRDGDSAYLIRSKSQADDPAFSATLTWAIRSVLLIAVPATLALIMLAEPVLATLFQYGAFSATIG